MKLYEYIGVDDIKYISSLEQSVWDYLKKRTGDDLSFYLVRSMKDHAKNHSLTEKTSSKWNIKQEDLELNIEGLAKYVADGILEVLVYITNYIIFYCLTNKISSHKTAKN